MSVCIRIRIVACQHIFFGFKIFKEGRNKDKMFSIVLLQLIEPINCYFEYLFELTNGSWVYSSIG